jgi:ubiquinone/menaquinone biosynthesis C-methylase UbiE
MHTTIDSATIVPSTEEINKFWDRISALYSMYFESNTCQGAMSLLNMLKICDSNDVLETGCGSGFILPMIISSKKKTSKYIMTDLSEKMLIILQKRIKVYTEGLEIPKEKLFFGEEKFEQKEYSELGISVQRENSETLSFQNSTFDVYLSNISLQIVENPEKMLNEAYRVLRPGGKIGISVWGKEELSRFQTLIPEAFKKNNQILEETIRSNFHLNDKKKLRYLLESAGFVEIKIWDQFIPMPVEEREVFSQRVEMFQPGKKVLESLSKAEADLLKQKILDDIMNEIYQSECPIGIDLLFAVGRKL